MNLIRDICCVGVLHFYEFCGFFFSVMVGAFCFV